ncbi:unannotated protein [freshwater metagenome]|uniref:Unannotated protein n=1 Tax=freshwater metagenome TaxID=449393 RepID=A0A6J6ZTQ0_9ZZZZ
MRGVAAVAASGWTASGVCTESLASAPSESDSAAGAVGTLAVDGRSAGASDSAAAASTGSLGSSVEVAFEVAGLAAADFFAAAFLAGAFLAAAFLAGAFLTGSGSSGCCSRIRPSRLALRRTPSA